MSSTTKPILTQRQAPPIAPDPRERQSSEGLFRDSEEPFRLLVDGAIDYAIIMLDPYGKVASWNPGAERITGYRADEIIGEHFSRFYPELAQQVGWPEHELALVKSDGRFEDEGWRVRKDGAVFWANVVLTALKDPQGRLKGFCKITRDLSERKRTEEALRRKSMFLQLLQEVTVASNEAGGVDKALQVCLDLVCAATGWPVGHVYHFPDSTKELSPMTLWHVGVPARFDKLRRQTTGMRFLPGSGLPGRVLVTGKPAWITDVTVEPTFRRAALAKELGLRAAFAFPVLTGKEVAAVLEFFAVEAVTPDDVLLEVMANIGTQIGRVIERARAAEAMRQSELRFRSVAESANEAIISADSAGKIIYWNREAQAAFGYTGDEAIGKPVSLLIPERYRDDQRQGLERYQRTGEGRIIGKTIELWGLRKTGAEFPLELSLSSWQTGEETFFTAMIRDITERKQAEEENSRLNKQLRQWGLELEAANRELEAFSYSVSHDLRAPLRAMDGFSRLLLQNYLELLPGEARRHLHSICDNARKMGRLIDDLLNFSRLIRQPLQKQAVALESIVRQALSDLHVDSQGRRLDIMVGKLPVCQADPALLKQVLVNLLSNAIKYTRPREIAVIEIGCSAGDADNAETVCFVKDNGVGFDMRYAHKLFGVFQRLHRAEEYEGTGVGLAIVERIIHRHGGRVWAEAEPDRGATFHFTLGNGSADA